MSGLFYFLNHLLLPGYSNNQKAKILHSESIVFLILLLIAGQFSINYFPNNFGLKILGYASQISVDEVIRLTNEKRASQGMATLTFNPLLAQAAKAKAEDMINNDYWAHVSPNGTQPWKFFNDVGYKYRYAGENLAKDFSSPTSAVDAWMASPSHKDNMLSSKYDEIGVAVIEGDLNGNDTTIIVQLFGKQYDSSLKVATTNVSAKTEKPNSNIQITTFPTPTASPVAVVIPTKVQEAEIARTYEKTIQEPTSFQVLISPFSTKKGFSIATTSLLLVTFAFDSIFLIRKKTPRVGGKTFAHIVFLGMILAVIILIQSGEIIPPASDAVK